MYYVGGDRDKNNDGIRLFFPLLTSYTMECMETLKMAMEASDTVQRLCSQNSDATPELRAGHNIREERKLGMNNKIIPSMDSEQLD